MQHLECSVFRMHVRLVDTKSFMQHFLKPCSCMIVFGALMICIESSVCPMNDGMVDTDVSM